MRDNDTRQGLESTSTLNTEGNYRQWVSIGPVPTTRVSGPPTRKSPRSGETPVLNLLTLICHKVGPQVVINLREDLGSLFVYTSEDRRVRTHDPTLDLWVEEGSRTLPTRLTR